MLPRHARVDFHELEPHSADQRRRVLKPVRRVPRESAFDASRSRDRAGLAQAAPAQIAAADRDHGTIRSVSRVDSFRSGRAASWLLALFARHRAAWRAAQERRVQRVIRQGLSHIE
jgi:hypothetical protein